MAYKLPFQPMFSAYSNTDQLDANVGNTITVSCTVVEFNIGNCYDGINKFTAPVKGIYIFNAGALVTGPDGGVAKNFLGNYGALVSTSATSTFSGDYDISAGWNLQYASSLGLSFQGMQADGTAIFILDASDEVIFQVSCGVIAAPTPATFSISSLNDSTYFNGFLISEL